MQAIIIELLCCQERVVVKTKRGGCTKMAQLKKSRSVLAKKQKSNFPKKVKLFKVKRGENYFSIKISNAFLMYVADKFVDCFLAVWLTLFHS